MFNITELENMTDEALRETAKGLGLQKISSMDRQDMVYGILDQQAIDKAAADAQRPPKKKGKKNASGTTADAPAADNGPVTGHCITAPMPGTIVEIKVKPGDSVKKGQTVVVFEAMKMENEIEADRDGVIKRILCAPGAPVAADAAVIEYQD